MARGDLAALGVKLMELSAARDGRAARAQGRISGLCTWAGAQHAASRSVRSSFAVNQSAQRTTSPTLDIGYPVISLTSPPGAQFYHDDEGDVDDLELPVRPRRRSHATRAVRKREARLQAADLLKDMRVNVAESANIQREVTSILHGTQQQQPQQPPRDRRYRERHTFCEWLETTMEEIPDRVWGRFRREVTNLVFQFIDMGLEVNINEIFLIFIWASNFFVFSFGEVLVKFTIGINNW